MNIAQCNSPFNNLDTDDTADTPQILIKKYKKKLGLSNSSFLFIFDKPQNFNSSRFVSTYDPSWNQIYAQEFYGLSDPIKNYALQNDKSFFWWDIPLSGRDFHFIEVAARFGIGPMGYTFTTHDEIGNRSFLFLTSSTLSPKDWRYFIDSIQNEIHTFANSLHDKVLKETHASLKLLAAKNASIGPLAAP